MAQVEQRLEAHQVQVLLAHLRSVGLGGESGNLILEFWITPFDYSPCDGPQRAVESVLTENQLIGLSWCAIDYDDVNARDRVGFWNLSHKQTMFGNASDLAGFRLMPLEPQFRKEIQARFSYTAADMDRRLAAFKDESDGKVTSWKWLRRRFDIHRTESDP
jgi:hypothetical protein